MKQRDWSLTSATNARSAMASRVRVADGIMNAAAFHFRQRHGGGRFVPASFPPSLRLHFTFPLAEPLTETSGWHRSFLTWLWMK